VNFDHLLARSRGKAPTARVLLSFSLTASLERCGRNRSTFPTEHRAIARTTKPLRIRSLPWRTLCVRTFLTL
jgi:hypothetical protein